MKWIVSKEDHNIRLIHFLTRQKLPHQIWKKMKSNSKNSLLIAEKKRFSGEKLQVGEIIDLSDYFKLKFFEFNFSPKIVYESENLLILNKPPGILTHPSSSNMNEATLNDWVLHYYNSKNLPFLAHPVTRLDRLTSGITVYAKNPETQNFVQSSAIKKIYLAIVEGDFPENPFFFSAPIKRSEDSIIKRMIGLTGQNALTHFKLLDKKNNLCLIQCQIYTGRTHQIRVHLSSLGFPIVGDTLYGKNDNDLGFYCLHAWKLNFIDPKEGSQKITNDPPPIFKLKFPFFSF